MTIWTRNYEKFREPGHALHLFSEPVLMKKLNFLGIELNQYEPT